jgi:hypothetical protein
VSRTIFVPYDTFTHLGPNDDLLYVDKSLPADVHTAEAAAHAALLPFKQVISQPDCKFFAVVFLYSAFAFCPEHARRGKYFFLNKRKFRNLSVKLWGEHAKQLEKGLVIELCPYEKNEKTT